MPSVTPKAYRVLSFFSFVDCGSSVKYKTLNIAFSVVSIDINFSHMVTLQFKTSLLVGLNLPGKEPRGGGDLF